MPPSATDRTGDAPRHGPAASEPTLHPHPFLLAPVKGAYGTRSLRRRLAETHEAGGRGPLPACARRKCRVPWLDHLDKDGRLLPEYEKQGGHRRA